MARPHLLLVTGKLAEPALRRTLADLGPSLDLDATVAVLPITVVALAPTSWIARHLPNFDTPFDRAILPGLCQGDLVPVSQRLGCPVVRGPEDLRDLPEFLGGKSGPPSDYGAHDIAILAEINHAPRLCRAELLAQARHYRDSGADVIDVGCDPGPTWSGAGEAVRSLREEGYRVSIDSFNIDEVADAVAAGAELVLSVNSGNLDAARDWGCEVVVMPDDLDTLGGLDHAIERLLAWGVPFRIDPVLAPISMGFAASLGRYLEVRRRYPDAEMMMGVGNLTELTDVDSAGVNVTLLAFCQEVGIRSVLTTEVINWARSSVREIALARRLVYHAVTHRVLPKRLEPGLVMLRDSKLSRHGEAVLRELAERITDRNFRLFAEEGRLHVLNGAMHLSGTDPFELFAEVEKRSSVDPSHAFYLGYELAKAVTALTLGKNYVQDQALRWGMLTRPETTHRAPTSDETRTANEPGA